MAEKSDVFKCEKCQTIVAVLQAGECTLECCGEKMRKATPDEAKRLAFGMSKPGSP